MRDLRSNDPNCSREIVVGGFTSARARLRISVLLNTMPECHATYLEPGQNSTEIIKNANLIIGAGDVARDGILHQKPCIVVGNYGLGGLVNMATFRSHFDNNFKGRIDGKEEEYFSLERLENEIKQSESITSQELKMMSNQMEAYLHDTANN